VDHVVIPVVGIPESREKDTRVLTPVAACIGYHSKGIEGLFSIASNSGMKVVLNWDRTHVYAAVFGNPPVIGKPFFGHELLLLD